MGRSHFTGPIRSENGFQTALSNKDDTTTFYIPDQIEITHYSASSIDDEIFYIANKAYEVTAIKTVHVTKGSDGGAVTLQIERLQGTETSTNGDDLMSATLNMKGDAATVQSGAMVATSVVELAAGDRLGTVLTGTTTALAGLVVTVSLKALA